MGGGGGRKVYFFYSEILELSITKIMLIIKLDRLPTKDINKSHSQNEYLKPCKSHWLLESCSKASLARPPQIMMTSSNWSISVLLALCVGYSPVPGEFPSQRPVTRSFDIFFEQCLNKRFSKQSWGWWFEMPSRSMWRHCNGITASRLCYSHMLLLLGFSRDWGHFQYEYVFLQM